MKREYKFRAWDGEEMIYPPQRYGSGMIYVGDLFRKFPTSTMEGTPYEDKTGKTIYEGDILNFGYDRNFVVIQKERKVSTPAHGGSNDHVYFGYEIDNGYGSSWKNSKIVGNIYQNPDIKIRDW